MSNTDQRLRRKPAYMYMGGSAENSSRIYAGCEIHRSIAEKALSELTYPEGPGYFSKEAIVQAVKDNYPFVEMVISEAEEKGNIHWDYIVAHLSKEYGAQLIPLTHRFFKRATNQEAAYEKRLDSAFDSNAPLRDQIKSAQDEAERTGDFKAVLKLSGRAIAGGHGKKTAGYASVSTQTTGLVVTQLKRSAAKAKGVMGNYQKRVGAAEVRGVISDAIGNVHALKIEAS